MGKFKASLVAFIWAVSLILAASLQAKTLTLAWDDPDNPPGSVTGYKLYQGSESGVYTKTYDTGRSTIFTTPDLPPGTYFFAVTAYNATSESPKSGEATTTIEPPIVLRAPTTIIIKVE